MNKQRGFYNTEGAVLYGAVLCAILSAALVALLWLVPELWGWIKPLLPETSQ